MQMPLADLKIMGLGRIMRIMDDYGPDIHRG